jgi:hypothetical protein
MGLRLARFGCLAADPLPYFPHLTCQILLHVLSPNKAAGTVFIWAFIQASQLLPPFTNQRVEPH